jgi:Pyruvate/2-oxoacid:ferredoxin oxidoreductase delta subunit
MIKNIGIMCFSPTNTTRAICNAVASGMGSEKPVLFDMTRPDSRANLIANANVVINKIDHLIIGAPVYSGKLPVQAIECIKSFQGSGKECTAIVVYGNRDYGVALYNLVKILSENGFCVVAACAFIGQHSYSDIVPVAMGRPDKSDIDRALNYGARILRTSKHLSLEDVPVHLDKSSKSDKYPALKPSFKKNKCVKCANCAKACPLGLLSPDTGEYLSKAAKKQCIGCMACVRNCTEKAKVANNNPIVKIVMNSVLKQALRERKEPFIII